ncbi:MAG: sulfotransferase [Cyanobacteria bacterium P01_C01_bin.72]
MEIKNFALIIGAMKCGTTSLFDYLSQHPEIAPCKLKEPQFFSRSNNFQRGFSYYRSLWNWNQDHQFALEATPGYTKVTHRDSANAAENIKQTQIKYNLKFKFIYIMRDPWERIESQCIHNALKSSNREEKVSEVDPKIVDASKYALQIKEFYDRFPSEDILLLNFDELKTDPEGVLYKICCFLDIDSSFEFSEIKVIHNSRNRQIIRIPGWQKLRVTAPMLYINSVVSNNQKNIFKTIFGKSKNVKCNIPEDVKQKIISELNHDLRKLKENYGFNIDCWSSK